MEERRPAAGHRRVAPGGHSRSPGAHRQLPPRVFRRHAPARNDRRGAGLQPESADRRRADHRPGCDGAGANPAAVAGPARSTRAVDHHDHPRPRRGRANLRRHCRDVCRAPLRARQQIRPAGPATAPVHRRFDRLSACPQQWPRLAAHHPRAAAVTGCIARRLPVQPALPAGRRLVYRGAAGRRARRLSLPVGSAAMSLLQIKDLEVKFAASGTGLFGLNKQWVRAVNGVSLNLAAGETLGLVGESGSGKSTLGRAILHLNPISAGQVLFDGVDMAHGSAIDITRLRHETAMIFQDPYAALNPRHTIGETIAEVLRVQRKVAPQQIPARVNELLDLVGLRPELADRKPGSLSGGQCQRVGIARALAVEPRLIIADECVAALDVSIQGQIINLLLELQQRMNLAILFIAHDLAIVRRLCDRVAVMYLGKIVEEGPVEAVFTTPRHPYTAALIQAIPEIDPHRPLPTEPLPGEPPSPLNLPTGCAFHPRCRHARSMCSVVLPPTHFLHEHRYSCVLEEPLL
ncbi:hypothetical protein ALQ38_05229 [Pseudomonas marginalis pv. marginalis]|nr:hypothetical protein ALQ38_05229 [Pseudomonas marginalis pv. marginalis]